VSVRPEAFDAFAADYDQQFTDSAVGRLLRRRVWRRLAQIAQPGQRVLELACGTGADAVWLAQRGLTVVATDGSAEMVAQTRAKAAQAGAGNSVAAEQLSFQAIIAGERPGGENGPVFDGLLSDFGGLNTISAWRPLAERLAGLIRAGGWLVLVVMGPFCPWEIGWYLAHGRPGMAFRRRGRAEAWIGPATLPIWYPSAGHLRRAFAPWFSHRGTESLGLLLPPSYLNHLVERRPGLFVRLAAAEALIARRTLGWGDHYVLQLEREPG
jgi:SAM-dependent methyltransferase